MGLCSEKALFLLTAFRAFATLSLLLLMTALRSNDVVSNVFCTGDEEQSASLDEWELLFERRVSFAEAGHPVWRSVTTSTFFSLLLLMLMASLSSLQLRNTTPGMGGAGFFGVFRGVTFGCD